MGSSAPRCRGWRPPQRIKSFREQPERVETGEARGVADGRVPSLRAGCVRAYGRVRAGGYVPGRTLCAATESASPIAYCLLPIASILHSSHRLNGNQRQIVAADLRFFQIMRNR